MIAVILFQACCFYLDVVKYNQMNLRHQLRVLDKSFHPKMLIVFRIGLGLGLFLKGIQFVQDKSLIRHVFSESLILQDYFWLQTLIPWLSLLCGVFIILGLFTRLATLIQIPILVGSIVFVNSKKGVYAGETELWFSILILILLIVFLFEGGGPLSWDKSIQKEKEEESEVR